MLISQRPIVDKKLILSLIELVFIHVTSNFHACICSIYLYSQKLKKIRYCINYQFTGVQKNDQILLDRENACGRSVELLFFS